METKFFLFLAVLFVAFPMADPAKKIITSLSGDTLTVIAIHKTRNIKKHYINRITVSTKDSTLFDEKYTEQTDKEKMEKKFILTKDEISKNLLFIEATCNKYGVKTAKFIPSKSRK